MRRKTIKRNETQNRRPIKETNPGALEVCDQDEKKRRRSVCGVRKRRRMFWESSVDGKENGGGGLGEGKAGGG